MDSLLTAFFSLICLVLGAACSRAAWWTVPGTPVPVYFWLLGGALVSIVWWIAAQHLAPGARKY